MESLEGPHLLGLLFRELLHLFGEVRGHLVQLLLQPEEVVLGKFPFFFLLLQALFELAADVAEGNFRFLRLFCDEFG